MASPRKSPNIMSTMGRMPVIAPPTPMPVIPASEMGVSITREVPNSSTRPESTLNGVPASATSSPMINTCGSRRISSAKASRMAWPRVTSRTLWPALWLAVVLGIDILLHLARVWIRCVERKLLSRLDFGSYPLLDLLKCPPVSHPLFNQPVCQQFQGIAFRLPALFLFSRAVVGALDVTDMVPHKAVRIAEHEGWSLTPASTLNQTLRRVIDCANILSIHRLAEDTKGFGPGAHLTGSSLGIGGVFVILVVFTHVDDGEFPQRGHIHHFVQHSLAKRAIPKEADRHLVAAAHLARHSSSGSKARASPDDGIRVEVAGVLFSDMHGAALAAAI